MSEVKESGHIRIVGAFAGIGSGLSKVAVGHGFDTVKTRLQCSPPGTYRGAIDCLVKIVKNESPLALYKGATPPAVGWAAIDSLLLGSLHNYRLFLIRHGLTEKVTGTDRRRLTLAGHGLAGFGAGLTSAILATPIEHLKIRLQMQMQRSVTDREFKGPIDCIKQVVRHRGVLGLWSGFTGSLAFRANFLWMFGSIEVLMRGFSSLHGTSFEMTTGTANFLAGGLASFSFWTMAIPADNIKNRMMASSLHVPSPSFGNTMRHVYTTVGLTGFFSGLTPCFLRAFPTNACAYYVYEGLMRAFDAEKTRH